MGSVSQGKCPFCGGTGFLLVDAYVSRRIKYNLKKLFMNHDVSIALIYAHPVLAAHMTEHKAFSQECSSIWSHKRIYVIPDETLDFSGFRVVSGMGGVPTGAELLT